MDFLKGKNRLGLYLLLLAVLALGALAAVWSVTGTGAYLTGEGDWQTLAGDWRIGTIDYTVRINDQLLLGRSSGSESLAEYELVAPIKGGVKMFDPAPLTATVLDKEFNEGATLLRLRVTNYSRNIVEVTAQLSLPEQTAGDRPIRMLALPVTLGKTTATTFNYRQYILDTLGNPADLDAMNTAYDEYIKKHPQQTLELGLLPGSVSGTTAPPGVGDDKILQDGNSWCYYRDVFLVVWTEYGDGEFNTAVDGATGTPRQGRFFASFSVGQLD